MSRSNEAIGQERAEIRRERHRAWVAKNRERVREISRKSKAKKRAEDPDAYREYNRLRAIASRKKHPEKVKVRNQRANLKRYYGLTIPEYEAMLAAQGGRCALCGREPDESLHKRLYVDHDHETQVIRGLLCYRCNASLGQLGDNLTGIQKVVNYLLRAEAYGRKIA